MAMFMPAHLIHSLHHMVHDVKTVKNDLAAGVRNAFESGLDIRGPHVYDDGFEARLVLCLASQVTDSCLNRLRRGDIS